MRKRQQRDVKRIAESATDYRATLCRAVAMTMAAGSAPNDDAKQAIERRILKTLQATGTIADSLQFSHENGWAHLDVVGVILSLSTANMVAFSVTNEDVPKLTEEGELYAKAGSPEAQVYNAVSADGSTTRDALLQRLGKDMGSIGMSQAIRLKWIKPGRLNTLRPHIAGQ